MRTSKVQGVWRLFRFTSFTIFFTLPFWIISKINDRACYAYGRFYLNMWRKAMGHRLIVDGEAAKDKPTLFVANHTSYMDIPVLGSCLDGRFVAKNEVKQWPVFGFLSGLYGSVYIERSRNSVADGSKILEKELAKGQNLILFPEGTTSDHCRVLPFGSSFFDVAIKNDLTVQPVTVAYVGWDGMPVPRYLRKIVGWFSPDMELLPHLWQIAQLGKIQVVVTLHPPMKAHDFKSRKDLSQKSWQMVNQGLFDTFSTPISKRAA